MWLGSCTVLLVLVASCSPCTASSDPASSTQLQPYQTQAEPGATGRYAPDPTNDTETAASTISGDGPRRRPREQWDMVGPALLLGGTLALLVLAAVAHLASKALLASMLSAALSAVQLSTSRQPGPNRQG